MEPTRVWTVLGAIAVAVVMTVEMAFPVTALAASWHGVRPGESLWVISRDFGTTVSSVEQANGLSRSIIWPGQRLLVPKQGEAVHWVHAGQSLFDIATAYGTTVQHLVAMNDLHLTVLHVGQRLTVPVIPSVNGTRAATTAATPAQLSFQDSDLLARLVTAEAEAEPYVGQVAVASVILNRVNSPEFPNSVYGVIYQVHQFETVSNGRIDLPATAAARQAVRDAENGWDPSYGALFFWNPSKAYSAFLSSQPFTTQIGGHRFAK